VRSLARMNSIILRQLGDETEIGGRRIKAYYRRLTDYTNLTEKYISENVQMNISAEDYDPELFVKGARVWNVDQDTYWIVGTWARAIDDGEYEFELSKDVNQDAD